MLSRYVVFHVCRRGIATKYGQSSARCRISEIPHNSIVPSSEYTSTKCLSVVRLLQERRHVTGLDIGTLSCICHVQAVSVQDVMLISIRMDFARIVAPLT